MNTAPNQTTIATLHKLAEDCGLKVGAVLESSDKREHYTRLRIEGANEDGRKRFLDAVRPMLNVDIVHWLLSPIFVDVDHLKVERNAPAADDTLDPAYGLFAAE